ncbi:MAG TPA: hypothetical protein VJB57_04300 [Dehalococcoidia bacterium]|nr:hypothetical protein [Dehalococcoidia bacterium]
MHQHDDQRDGQDDDMGGMGHGSGIKGMALMALCCLPMIAIVVLLAIGVLK